MSILLLLACSPELLPDAALLEDAPLLEERIDPIAFTMASFSPGGEHISLSPDEGFTDAMPALDWTDDHVQAAWSDRSIRLAVWLEREELQPWLIETTWGDAGFGSGVWLDAGQAVEAERFEHTTEVAVGAVWGLQVDPRTVDEVRPEEWPEAERVEIPPDAWLARDALVLNAPEGRPFAEMDQGPEEDFYVRGELLDEDGAYLNVRYRGREGVVRGWMHQDDVLIDDERFVGWGEGISISCGGCGGFGTWGSSWSVTLHPGDVLYDEMGDEVGVVTAQVEVIPKTDGRGEYFVRGTPWGAVELYI